MSIFDNVAFPKHKRNVFDMSHEFRCTAKFGALLPIFCEEVLPGDTWQIKTDSFVRAMPMLAPLMHRVNIYTHFFFVPNRLVWDEWKDFITGGEDGTANPTFPTVVDSAQPGSLADYLGCSNNSDVTGTFSALPFRAYNLIWNEYYRDQNLQEESPIDKSSGRDNVTSKMILDRNWEKDYFTSALPWTQRGPEVTVPIGDSADIVFKDGLLGQTVVGSNGVPITNDSWLKNVGGVLHSSPDDLDESTIAQPAVLSPSSYEADLSTATGIDINELRRSIALQRWLEANARGGSRYIEQIFSHFGVTSSDARLQRPEFLGGGKQPLSISEVLQTSSSTENSDLGEMAGHGISASRTKQFRRYFEEHGLIIGIMSIMPKSSYMQGTRRFLQKNDRFDFAFPEFANLGEQEVWNSEIYTDARNGAESGVFGYQSRYSEYKYIPSTVHGALKKDAFAPWTLVRKFQALPPLNQNFVRLNWLLDETGRIFPVEDSNEQFVVQLYHNVKAIRILPKHVIPSI